MNSEITAYVQKAPAWQQTIFNDLRTLIHDTVPGVEEKMQYQRPHFKKDGKNICAMIIAKNWVNLTIFNLTDVDASQFGFEASSAPGVYSIKVTESGTVNQAAVTKLIKRSSA